MPVSNRKFAEMVGIRLVELVLERELPSHVLKRVLAMKAVRDVEDIANDYIPANKKLMQKRFRQIEKEVLAKIKKPGKVVYHEDRDYWINKAKFDVSKWMFSKKKWRSIFIGDGEVMASAPMVEGGQYILDDLAVEMTFDQTDPLAIEWLATNSKNMAWSITDSVYERLRKTLMEAVADGDSIPEIRERVKDVFENLSKVQAELIARTETLKATNRGVWLGMKQSGVVEGKQWLAAIDERTCTACEEMDGATMPLDDPFFEQGSSHTIGGLAMNFDYEEIIHPPLHVSCRCTLLAILKGV